MKKVAVVGSRAFDNYELLWNTLDKLRKEIGDFILVSGGAVGADTYAEWYAKANNFPVPIIFQAQWDDLSHSDAIIKQRKDGNKYDAFAGIRRNQLIVDACDMIVAFWDGKSRGTYDTIQKGKRAGKPVQIVKWSK